jgi:hypothetical protein
MLASRSRIGVSTVCSGIWISFFSREFRGLRLPYMV